MKQMETEKMEIFPTRETLDALVRGGQYNTIPLWTEVYADAATPIEVLRRL